MTKRRTIHSDLLAACRSFKRLLDDQDKAVQRFERALTPARRSNGRKAAVSKRS